MVYKIKSFLESNLLIDDIFSRKDKFVADLIGVSASEDNYWVGFGSEVALKDFLLGNIFSSEVSGRLTIFEEGTIEKTIKETLTKVSKMLDKKEDLEFFLFPTFSKFVVEKMDGVFGFTPSSSLIHVYLNQGDSNEELFL